MDKEEFPRKGSSRLKKWMLGSWVGLGGLFLDTAIRPGAFSKDFQMTLLIMTAYAVMPLLLTLVYLSSIMTQPPLDPDGRMSLPKEPKPEERWK